MITLQLDPSSPRSHFVNNYLSMYELAVKDSEIVREDGKALTPADIRVGREILERSGVVFEEVSDE